MTDEERPEPATPEEPRRKPPRPPERMPDPPRSEAKGLKGRLTGWMDRFIRRFDTDPFWYDE